MARYVQPDPIGLEGGTNSYAYAESDPVGSIDPLGLSKRGQPVARPNPNILSNAQANSLINQIQQFNPQFQYPPNLTLPGQGGYTPADVQFLQGALARTRACLSCAQSAPPRWPNSPQDMDQFLGVPGIRKPDGPTTAGRGTIIWRPSSNVTIKFERHPYDVTAPTFHCGPHWHLEGPLSLGGRPLFRQTFVPGEFMPGF